MKKNHAWLLVLSILFVPSLSRADGEKKADEAKSTPLPLRRVTDSYVLPDGRTVTFLVKETEVREPLAPWVKPLAIGSAIGLVPGAGIIIVAALKLQNAETPAREDTWSNMMKVGIVVTSVSFMGLAVAGAVAVSRPPATQNVTITPVVSAHNSGLMMTGTF